ncbi:MAG TPA: hypothetical protein PLU53_05500, partial [Bacteroidia bacterium]|nr:hypothetical protein [Bacteroidia bacterium]
HQSPITNHQSPITNHQSPITFLLFFLFFLYISFNSYSQDLDVVITVSKYVSGTDISCHDAHDGSMEAVIVGGAAPYSYQWNSGSYIAYTKSISNLGPGEYFFTVIDGNNDTVTKSGKIYNVDALATNPVVSSYAGGYTISYQGGNDGSIETNVSGGTSPYTVLWNTGQQEQNISDLTAGTYTFTVTDDNQCTLTTTVTLTEPTPLHIVSITSPLFHDYNIACHGTETGSINLTVEGGVPPYTYFWNSGDTARNLDTLKTGTYTVQITDANNAHISGSIVLTQPGEINYDLSATVYSNGKNTTCFNCADGYVTSNAGGGVSPYTYLWNTGQTTANLSGVIARNYSLLVTDVNGCTRSKEITLTQPDRSDWTILGNTGTSADSNYIGTSDTKDFVIKTNAVERLRIKASGEISVPFSEPSNKLIVSRITSPDSVLFIGDSTLVLDYSYNRIYGDRNGNVYKGTGLGENTYAFGMQSLAIGFGTASRGEKAITLGNNVHTSANATNSIAIGSGGFTLDQSNTFAIGFNSNKPTLVVRPANGTGTTGKVGIGLDDPTEKLEIGHSDQTGGMVLNHIPVSGTTNWHSEIKFNSGTDQKWALGNDLYHQGDQNFFIRDNASSNTRFLIDPSGRVGIGTSTPGFMLDVNTGDNTSTINGLKITTHHGTALVNFGYGLLIDLDNNTTKAIVVRNSGVTNFRLDATGVVSCREIYVTQSGLGDFVYNKSYPLLSIKQLEEFTSENHHLPGVPTAEEVKEKGMNVGDFQNILLQKIEEQSLYIISLQKQVDELRSSIQETKK